MENKQLLLEIQSGLTKIAGEGLLEVAVNEAGLPLDCLIVTRNPRIGAFSVFAVGFMSKRDLAAAMATALANLTEADFAPEAQPGEEKEAKERKAAENFKKFMEGLCPKAEEAEEAEEK